MIKNCYQPFLFLALSFLSFLWIPTPLQAQDFSNYQWENRVLLVIYSAEEDSLRKQQECILEMDEAGLNDRRIKVFFIGEEEYTLWGGMKDTLSFEARSFLESYEVKDFAVLLLGLDGGMKLKTSSPIELSQLFSLIDRMPMRRAEMKTKN